MDDIVEICPYCSKEIFIELLGPHKSHCRKIRGSMEPTVTCVFNSMHVVPMSEKLDHLRSCSDRQYLPDEWVQQELAKLAIEEKEEQSKSNAPLTKKDAGTTSNRNLTSDKSAFLATFNSLPQIRRLQSQAYSGRQNE